MPNRYATEDQIKNKIPELNNIVYWDSTKITEQENFAAAEVDADLSQVYTVPFSAVIGDTPIQIQELCSILSAVKILEIEYRRHNHNVADYTQAMREIYEKKVEDYRSGKKDVVDSTGTPLGRISQVVSNTRGQDPVFGMAQFGEFTSDRSEWDNVKDNE